MTQCAELASWCDPTKSVAIAYSWPSHGTAHAYLQDENNVEWTEPHLTQFLLLLQTTGAQTINIIAHSMGNRAVSRALAQISREAPMARFSNIVLAAPDIDRDVFRQLAAVMASTADLVTLYASDHDGALTVARTIKGYPRAGDCVMGIMVCDGVMSIDVSAVSTNFLGHSYYGENASIISDLYYLLRGKRPPRFRLRPVSSPSGSYWKFVPSH